MPENVLFSHQSDHPQLLESTSVAWRHSDRITMDRDWKGRSFLQTVGLDWAHLTQVASAWDQESIYFFFACWFLNSPRPEESEGEKHFWQGDTLKLNLRPPFRDDYFDIEVNPRNQWLAAHVRDPSVDINHFWRPNLSLSTDISEEERIWRLVIRLPFNSLAGVARPVPGTVWRVNLYRTIGAGENPEWLFWRPTFSPQPDFHHPASFGNLFFMGD